VVLALAGADGVAVECVSPGLCVVAAGLLVGAGDEGALSAAASPPGFAGSWLAGGAAAAAAAVSVAGRSTEGSREAFCFFSAGVSLPGRLTTCARYADLCTLLPPAPAGLPPVPCSIPQEYALEAKSRWPGSRGGKRAVRKTATTHATRSSPSDAGSVCVRARVSMCV